MLKGLDGVTTHTHREWIPIVANDQDMTRLAGVVERTLWPASDRARVPARASRSLHLGRDDRGGRTARRDPGVSVRDDRQIEGSIAMALIRIPVEDRTITDPAQIAAFLATQGIDYERAEPVDPGRRRIGARGVARGLQDKDRRAQGARWLRHRRRHRRVSRHAESRGDAQQVQLRALARRGRSPLHRRGPRGVSHSSERPRRCSRSKSKPEI